MMAEYVKKAGVWRIRAGGSDGITEPHAFVKRDGVWAFGQGRRIYVRRAGVWRGQYFGSVDALSVELVRVEWPAPWVPGLSTVEALAEWLQPSLPAEPDPLTLISYTLDGPAAEVVIESKLAPGPTVTAINDWTTEPGFPWPDATVTPLGAVA